MCILDGKSQDNDIGIRRTDPHQVEGHAEIFVTCNELRRQFAIGTEMIEMGAVFPLKKGIKIGHHNHPAPQSYVTDLMTRQTVVLQCEVAKKNV